MLKMMWSQPPCMNIEREEREERRRGAHRAHGHVLRLSLAVLARSLACHAVDDRARGGILLLDQPAFLAGMRHPVGDRAILDDRFRLDLVSRTT